MANYPPGHAGACAGHNHHNQTPKDKCTIVAGGKLRAVFGQDSADMFQRVGILGNHLRSEP